VMVTQILTRVEIPPQAAELHCVRTQCLVPSYSRCTVASFLLPNLVVE
jgi:hypothetical protein